MTQQELASQGAARVWSIDGDTVAFIFSLHQWGAKRAADKSEITSGADKSMLTVTKKLIDSKEYKAVTDYLLEVKRYVLSRSVPSFFRDGCYLFRLGLVEDVERELEFRKIMLQGLVDELVRAYPGQINEAAVTLGPQFRRADYPMVDELQRSFYWSTQWVSFRVPEDLPASIRAVEQAKAENMWSEAAESITFALRESFQKLVSHAVEVMKPSEDGKAKRFYDSTITNITEFLQTFRDRNITNDSELEALVIKAQTVLTGIEDASLLKKDTMFRGKVLEGFKKLETDLDKLVQVKPSRKFDFDA